MTGRLVVFGWIFFLNLVEAVRRRGRRGNERPYGASISFVSLSFFFLLRSTESVFRTLVYQGRTGQTPCGLSQVEDQGASERVRI